MMRDANLEIQEIKPLTLVARPNDPLWNWPLSYSHTFLPRVIEAGHLTQGEMDAILAEWDANTADVAGFFVTPPQFEILAVKPA